MIPAELIVRKRDGGSLDRDEWAAFFSAYQKGDVAEYQVAAMLMAIFFQGLNEAETDALTEVMMDSGERWRWDGDAPVGDKHSTGGVGDRVSLVLAPLAAACGVRVPMVTGRSLGHTAGTLDKLEAIPGYRTELDRETFARLLDEVGFAMGGQTDRFAPLDREIYALRDVTGTVESIPLITASILSKKVAEGLDALILDVKSGDGAFLRSIVDAESLARSMMRVGTALGVRTEALITDMSMPLGRTVGHTLEVRESIEMLRGEAVDERFAEVTTALTARLLELTGIAADDVSARERIEVEIGSGAALEKFTANVAAQGGDPRVVDDPDIMGAAPVRLELEAPSEAYLGSLPARAVGRLLVELGGGRRVKSDSIDPLVGLEFPHPVGSHFDGGEVWAVVHARTEGDAEGAAKALESIVEWSDESPPAAPVVARRLTGG